MSFWNIRSEEHYTPPGAEETTMTGTITTDIEQYIIEAAELSKLNNQIANGISERNKVQGIINCLRNRICNTLTANSDGNTHLFESSGCFVVASYDHKQDTYELSVIKKATVLPQVERCPYCHDSLQGEPIREDNLRHYGGATHFSLKIAAASQWKCPHCKESWRRA